MKIRNADAIAITAILFVEVAGLDKSRCSAKTVSRRCHPSKSTNLGCLLEVHRVVGSGTPSSQVSSRQPSISLIDLHSLAPLTLGHQKPQASSPGVRLRSLQLKSQHFKLIWLLVRATVIITRRSQIIIGPIVLIATEALLQSRLCLDLRHSRVRERVLRNMSRRLSIRAQRLTRWGGTGDHIVRTVALGLSESIWFWGMVALATRSVRTIFGRGIARRWRGVLLHRSGTRTLDGTRV